MLWWERLEWQRRMKGMKMRTGEVAPWALYWASLSGLQAGTIYSVKVPATMMVLANCIVGISSSRLAYSRL